MNLPQYHRYIRRRSKTPLQFANLGFPLAILLTALSGCSGAPTHLHNSQDAALARKASETLDSLKMPEIITTARNNFAMLEQAEIQAQAEFNDAQLKMDLISLIDPVASQTTSGSSNASVSVGWRKLERERDAFLKLNGQENINKDQAGAICSLNKNEQELAKYRLELEKRNELFSARNPEGPPPSCTKFDPSARAADCSKVKSSHRNICSACQDVFKTQNKIEDSKKVLAEKFSDYKELDKEAKMLRDELESSKKKAKKIKEDFQKAKKDFDKASAELKEREEQEKGPTNPTADGEGSGETTGAKNASAMVAACSSAEEAGASEGEEEPKKNSQDAFQRATCKLKRALEAAQSFPLVGSELQDEFVTDLVRDLSFLGGAEPDIEDKPSAGAEKIATLFAIYAEVEERFKGGEVPPINSLRLELALQRMRHRRLANLRNAKEKKLRMIEEQRALIEAQMENWVQIAKVTVPKYKGVICEGSRVSELTNSTLKELQTKNKAVVDVFNKADRAQKRAIAQILIAYANAKDYERRQTILEIKRIQVAQQLSLDMSQLAVDTWNDLLTAPTAELLVYHEGGVTAEALANLIRALGLGTIAWGVNN